jgi:hypothetical protein
MKLKRIWFDFVQRMEFEREHTSTTQNEESSHFISIDSQLPKESKPKLKVASFITLNEETQFYTLKLTPQLSASLFSLLFGHKNALH